MTSMITARVNSEKRKKAEKVFAEVGLTTSAAVNLFICAVASTGGIPFAIGKTSPQPVTVNRLPENPIKSADRGDDARSRTGRATEFRRFIDALPKSGRTTPYKFSRADAEFRETRRAK